MNIPEELTSQVGFQITNTARLLFNRFNKEFSRKNFPIKAEQMPVLMVLFHVGNKSQQEIAEILQKDKAGIFRSIKTLEKMDFIRISIDPKDQRRTIIQITDEGKKLCKQAQKLGEEINNDITKGISEEQKKQLKNLLEIINKNILKN